ncbi:malate dehydrogenase, partial [candidate division KSB1 bacterium]|nr:malate dehydrogenase [candidate division KSB1 bacterium]
MTNKVRITVTGAAGQIGYAMLFRLASGQVFGPDTKIDLHLLEITPVLPALEGVVMELEDCAFPLLENIVVTDSPETAFDGVNWALLVGSKPRGKGMERGDLIRDNGPIFVGQGKALAAKAADDVRVLVVGNPANTNCLIAMNNAREIPRERFCAMTRLDQNRAMAQVAQKDGVSVKEVTNRVEVSRSQGEGSSSARFVPATVGKDLRPGDGVKTYPNSEARVDITIGDFTRINRTAPNTMWRLGEFAVLGRTIIELQQGKIFLFDNNPELEG